MSVQLVGSTYYDFEQLLAELALAGVVVSSLGTDGLTIFTFDDFGTPTALDPAAAPVIAAHVPNNLQRDLLALQLQSAVGLNVLNLSINQLQAFVACLGFKAGAIDRTSLAVLSPGTWMS